MSKKALKTITKVAPAPGTEYCTPEQEDLNKTTQSELMESKKECKEHYNTTVPPARMTISSQISYTSIALVLIGVGIGIGIGIGIGALIFNKPSMLEQEIIDFKNSFNLNIDYINRTKVSHDEINVQKSRLVKLMTAASDLKKDFADWRARTAQLISQISFPENLSENVYYENFRDYLASVNSNLTDWNKNFDVINASHYSQSLEITSIQSRVAFFANQTHILNSLTVENWNNFEQLPDVLDELRTNVTDVRAQQAIFAQLLE